MMKSIFNPIFAQFFVRLASEMPGKIFFKISFHKFFVITENVTLVVCSSYHNQQENSLVVTDMNGKLLLVIHDNVTFEYFKEQLQAIM
jgi:hypothetical protein